MRETGGGGGEAEGVNKRGRWVREKGNERGDRWREREVEKEGETGEREGGGRENGREGGGGVNRELHDSIHCKCQTATHQHSVIGVY